MSEFMNLPVDEIIMDTGTQSRVSMDLETVEAYADAMMEGDTFPAIVCFQEPGSNEPILADGWYRTMAAKQAGVEELLAEVIVGDLDDAILHAAGANAAHGVRRSSEDKRKAVNMLLASEKWKNLSSRQIAEAASVSQSLATVIMSERVSENSTGGSKGGTVVGKDGKSYPAKAKKAKPAKVERTSLEKLKEISSVYLTLPREPGDAVTEMAEGGECLSAGRAEHIAWWLLAYAKIVKEYTEEKDIVIDVPDEANG
jgi:hypothetical protein